MLLEISLAVAATYISSRWYNERRNKSKKESLIYDINEVHSLEISDLQKASKIKYAASLKRSKEVRIGMAEENMVAYHKDFPYDAGDVRPLGSPIDGLIFAGNVQGEIEEVILFEVKTGNSRLSKTQRQIKNIVEAGKVKWLEFRVKTQPVKLEHKELEELPEGDECVCTVCLEI